MIRLGIPGVFALGIVLFTSGIATAQMDALYVSLNRCADPSRLAETRIRDCMAVIGAKGIDQDEVAFAWLDLGLVYQSQGRDRQSELDAYSKAIELQPDLWQARANRASLYLEAGEAEKAMADYIALRQSGPDKVALYRAKNNLEYRTNDIEGTKSNRPNMDLPGREEADYANALNGLGHSLLTGFSNRCRARALAGLELDAALKDCESALQINQTDELSHQARGIAEFRLANWTAALGEFDIVLSTHPNAADTLYMKGVVERRTGHASAGDTDIAAARTIDTAVADRYARYGILP
ncbi:MAG TPA: tetratricopeptide repeat protein [Rhizomicrobium sp.]|jgi:tetratricopeptide (TPR) repeat protein